MKILLFISHCCGILLFLNSCSTSDSELSGAKIYIAKGLQTAVRNEFGRGEEYRYALKEIGEDKSEPENYRNKLNELYQSLLEMEKENAKVIKFIEKAKKEIFLSFDKNRSTYTKNNFTVYPYSEDDPMSIGTYKMDKVKYNGTTDILDPEGKFGKSLKPTFHSYRKAICELIASSVIVEEGEQSYYFNDPIVKDYSDVKDLEKQIEQAIQSSRVAQDDGEAIKQVYRSLSHNKVDWNQLLKDDIHWADALSILLQLENDVLSARTYAFGLLKSRSGCCENYGFNLILPMVFGPEVAYQGEDVYMEVLMVAFDSNKEPFVEAQGAEVVSIKDGKAKLKVNVGNAKEVTIKGTITIKNKSGVPKTEEWSKRIVVLKKE